MAVPPGNGKLQVIHLDANQGDACVIITPNGQVAMVDDGTNFTVGTSPPSCAKVLSQLQALGINHIDLHFASHYHADHIGCITSLSGVTIDQGWDRGGSYSSQTYTNYNTYLGGKRHTLTKGRIFTLDSLSARPVYIKCVALGGDGVSGASGDENALCLSLKVSWGDFDEEIGGDLTGGLSGTPNIEGPVGPQVGKIEVYKIHHHGSAGCSSTAWLAATTPKISVVSCGTGNTYGHPTSAAIGRLHTANVRTYWTQTGSGVAPNPAWDKVASGMVRIVANWEPGGVDSIYAGAYADTFTNYGTPLDHLAPTVAVTEPNGGESWQAGTVHTLNWSAADNVGVDSVNLDYSVHGAGGPWLPVQHAISNTGAYDWTVPAQVSDSVLVRVTAYDAMLNTAADGSDNLFSVTQAIVGAPGAGAIRFGLSQPRPNPTHGSIALRFALAQSAPTRVDIFDIHGRRVWGSELRDPHAGLHEVTWSGIEEHGGPAHSGLYFVRLASGADRATARFVVLR